MSLPRSEGAVSGWTPSLFDNDVVDVDFGNLQDMKPSASQNTYAPGSSRSVYTRESILTSPDYIPALNRREITSADKASSSAFAISSSDRRAVRNKLRDPSWVPRPRNAFIIFRCDYVREHARDAQGQTMLAKPSDKTLSKRAAEAWKKMADEEKAIFHARAEAEKDEHARQNPHYRFKPVRRPGQHGSTSRGGSTSRHSSRAGSRQSSRGGSVSRGRAERVSHGGSRRRRGPNFADNVHGWDDELATSMEESGMHRRGRSPPPGGRRRSSSMPESIVSEQDLDAWPPTLGPPSCSSSPGPWYDRTQGSSDSGDGLGDELSPLDSFGGAVDDALFNDFSFPSSTTYFSSQASLVGRPGLYPSQSLPAQSQSSLMTVRPPHPAASQASLLTVRPGRHFPGASQSSLLTVRPRHPSQASLIGLKPASPRQRPVPTPPQIPVFHNPKPHQLSSLSSLSTALADFSYDVNAPPAPAPVSATPSDASDQNTPYSSDSETEGRPQHMPMPAPGLPIPRPRPRFPQPQPQSQPPPQPPPPPPSHPHAAIHPVPIPCMAPGATGGMDQPHAGSWGSDVFEPQPLPPPPPPLQHTTSGPVPIPSPGSADGLSQPHTPSWGSDSYAAGDALDPQPWDARSFEGNNPSASLPPAVPPPPAPMWDDLDAFGAPPAPPAASSAMDADMAPRVFWDAEAFGGFQNAPAPQGQAEFCAQGFMSGQQATQKFGAQEYVQQEPIQQEYVQQEPIQQGYMQQEPIQQNPIQQDPMQAQMQMRAHDPGRVQTHLEAQGQMHAQEPMYGQDPMQMQAHLRAQMQMHAQDPGAMPQDPRQMQVSDPAAGYGAPGDLAGLEEFF